MIRWKWYSWQRGRLFYSRTQRANLGDSFGEYRHWGFGFFWQVIQYQK